MTQSGLCGCGCGRSTRIAPYSDRAKGWVNGEPLRYVQGHNNRVEPTRLPVPIEDRFWVNVREEDHGFESFCWIRGRSDTYGQVSFGSGTDRMRVGAHRWAYEYVVGKIPAGLEIDHLCRIPGCVNPAHMEPVTLIENVMRGESEPARFARRTHCSNGHPFSGENLGVSSAQRVCRICKREESRRRRARKQIDGTAANGVRALQVEAE